MALLLTPKFNLPPARLGQVSRPDLVAQVGQRPVTLISAPAGYGKTTLAAQRLRQAPKNCRAWLTLEADDNDPARFMRYLMAALELALPGLAKLGEAPDLRDGLDIILNALASSTQPILLALDDYQVIEAQAIHQTVSYLINHCPPTLHLILTTRTDPPLPLARLRARHQLLEIQARHLRFSADETQRFMTNAMGVPISPAEATALETRTEGWPAGLQLAALSLQGGSNVSHIVGTQRHIADYLFAEVFQRQSPQIQSFLLRTSILQRLNAARCAALLTESEIDLPNPDEAQFILIKLKRENLFLIELDEERHWYRYHALFAEFLQQRLLETEPKRVTTLHRKIGRWLAEQNQLDEALGHLLLAKDFESVTKLLDIAAVQWIRQGEFATLLAKLSWLPQPLIRNTPYLCIWQAWALVFSDRLDDVEAWLKPAEAHFLKLQQRAQTETSKHDDLMWDYQAGYGQAIAIRATLALSQQKYALAQKRAEEALALLPRNDRVLPAAMALIIGQAQLAQGSYAPAIHWLKQALADSHAAAGHHPYIHLNALLGLTRAESLRQQPQRARKLAKEALRFANEQKLPSLIRQAAQAQASLSATALPDPLNLRESEILRLLEQGLPNQVIADELIVAVSTVRWHIKHIYRKLGVHNRAQAAHRARQLGLA